MNPEKFQTDRQNGAAKLRFRPQDTFVLALQTIGGKVLGNSRRVIDNCNKLGDDTVSATTSRLDGERGNNRSCDRRGRRLPESHKKILNNRVKLTFNIRNDNSLERSLKISSLQSASPVIASGLLAGRQ